MAYARIGDSDTNSWRPPESWAVDFENETQDPAAPYSSDDEEQQREKTRVKKKRVRGSLGSRPMYQIRIYRANNSHHIVTCELGVTVQELTPQLNKKLLLDPDVEPHRLYLKERGRGREFISVSPAAN